MACGFGHESYEHHEIPILLSRMVMLPRYGVLAATVLVSRGLSRLRPSLVSRASLGVIVVGLMR